MDSGSNSTQLNNVGIDFIQEVSIKTSNFSAEYGRNDGASVNVVTRSGGKQFHGGDFEFIHNHVTDAVNPADNFLIPPRSTPNQLKPPPPLHYFLCNLSTP